MYLHFVLYLELSYASALEVLKNLNSEMVLKEYFFASNGTFVKNMYVYLIQAMEKLAYVPWTFG